MSTLSETKEYRALAERCDRQAAVPIEILKENFTNRRGAGASLKYRQH